ncbi:MAG: ABC transporter substrate-binding protein [Aminivibrio sp.]|jgi:peptide/nickel transport system substrate-binding protein
MKRMLKVISTSVLALILLFLMKGISVAASRDDINLFLNQAVEGLNPYNASSIVCVQLYCQIYDTLFFFNDKGELEPRIAKSYELADDNVTYTIHLRDDVKFHNGKKLTAEDAAWSIDYALNSGPYKVLHPRVPGFKSVKVLDDHTFEIVSDGPNPNILNNISMWVRILCKDEVLAAGDQFGIEWIPCGAGPYVVTSYNPDTEVELEAFKDYYQGPARINKVKYKILPDFNSVTIAFESGGLDFIAAPSASWKRFEANKNINTYLAPTKHTSFLHINTTKGGPLSNKKVRQALSYATDREAMVIAAYDDIAQPAYSFFNASSVFGGFTVEELEATGALTYQYDPEKAKTLLAEAGYPDGFDAGKILCIVGSFWDKMATIFQANLAEIGVTVDIEMADSASARARRLEQDYDIATTGNNFAPEASYGHIYFRYLSDEAKKAGDRSDLALQDQDLEDAYQKAMTEMDREKRKDLYLEVARILQDRQYSIPTFHKTTPYAYHKDLICDEINIDYYYVYKFHWK